MKREADSTADFCEPIHGLAWKEEGQLSYQEANGKMNKKCYC